MSALEVGAAILTIVPRTFFAGAVGLFGVLAWEAGSHFGLHARAWLYPRRLPLAAALAKFSDGLRRFAASAGKSRKVFVLPDRLDPGRPGGPLGSGATP